MVFVLVLNCLIASRNCYQAHSIPPARFLEVGPGSGAICLSLLKAWPLATAVAVDLCEHACSLTAENAARMGMSSRLCVQHVGIAEFAPGGWDAKFDLLVSNPPYIPSQDMATLEPEVWTSPIPPDVVIVLAYLSLLNRSVCCDHR